MMLDLFDFQTDAKNYLLDKTTDPNAKRKIIVKSIHHMQSYEKSRQTANGFQGFFVTLST